MIDEDFIEELKEFFEIQADKGDLKAAGIALLLNGHRTEQLQRDIHDYLLNRADADIEGCNREMSLLGKLEWAEQYAYWRPLWEGERQAGFLKEKGL